MQKLTSVKTYKNILLHIPHSSTTFPAGSSYSFDDLDDEEKLMIDYHTDKLFIPQHKSPQIEAVVFPYCRLFCDVERLIKDPLENEGLGISYCREVPSSNGRPNSYRSFGTKEEVFYCYIDFHSMVIKKLFALGDDTLLIDCHSFSAMPSLLVSNPPDIDICIGYNDDETCPDKAVIDRIVRHFESLGYTVGHNSPFSNSKTFSTLTNYHTIMIEVNKKVYMDEDTCAMTKDSIRLKEAIQSLYAMLLTAR